MLFDRHTRDEKIEWNRSVISLSYLFTSEWRYTLLAYQSKFNNHSWLKVFMGSTLLEALFLPTNPNLQMFPILGRHQELFTRQNNYVRLSKKSFWVPHLKIVTINYLYQKNRMNMILPVFFVNILITHPFFISWSWTVDFSSSS